MRSTPAGAITQFATLYMNWTWRTLAANERELAALSVGPARLSEQQAAAAAVGDSTIAQSRVYNSGQIISIAPSLTNSKQWVIVTREQTGGNSQYDGLQASYHVTLAELAQLKNGGWTVSEWLPRSKPNSRSPARLRQLRADAWQVCHLASTRVASAPPRRACGCSPRSASCWHGSRPRSRRAPIRTRRCTERSASSRA